MQRTFFDLIQRENERGATVLFSSHILSEVQRICDRVAIIKEGRIVDLRSIDDLRKNSYKKVSFTTENPIADFSLAGVRQIAHDGQQTSFLYSGDIIAGDKLQIAKKKERKSVKIGYSRSEERSVGKECRSRWSPYH